MNMNLMNLLADATEAAVASEEMSAGAQAIYMLVQFLPMIIIFVVFWFFLIRPQRKKDKEAQDMLKALKNGDRVTTIGGFYGTIVRIKDDVITIECGPSKTQMNIARWAIKSLDTSKVENESESLI